MGKKWLITCPDCNGTGICQTNNPGPSKHPHSCCGDCDRIIIPATDARVPAGFVPLYGEPYEKVIIGDGLIAVSFWRWLRWKLTGLQ